MIFQTGRHCTEILGMNLKPEVCYNLCFILKPGGHHDWETKPQLDVQSNGTAAATNNLVT